MFPIIKPKLKKIHKAVSDNGFFINEKIIVIIIPNNIEDIIGITILLSEKKSSQKFIII